MHKIDYKGTGRRGGSDWHFNEFAAIND